MRGGKRGESRFPDVLCVLCYITLQQHFGRDDDSVVNEGKLFRGEKLNDKIHIGMTLGEKS